MQTERDFIHTNWIEETEVDIWMQKTFILYCFFNVDINTIY
jgi:hypothetical protein